MRGGAHKVSQGRFMRDGGTQILIIITVNT